MKKLNIIWIIGSLIIGVLAYLASYNLFLGIAVFLLYIIFFFFFERKKFVSYFSLINRVHTCYHFINSFLITLSVKESLEDAYQSGIRINDKLLNEMTVELQKQNVYDRIIYLRSYFNLAIYKMFLNILDLYQDQGGNVLSMSDNLIRECTRTEKTLKETLSIGYKHLFEFILLWIMSFAVLLFMRFGISEFYQKMVADPLFLGLLFAYFLICLFSIFLFINNFTNLTVKEDSGS